MAEQTQDPRAALAAQIEGRSDDEIVKGIEAQGVDGVLDSCFQGMAAAFRPEVAGGQSAVVQYDVNAPSGKRSYQLRVAGGQCALAKGASEPARLTLALGLADFMRLVAGKLNGQQAFMQGKLKLQGDMTLAMVLQNWFAPR